MWYINFDARIVSPNIQQWNRLWFIPRVDNLFQWLQFRITFEIFPLSTGFIQYIPNVTFRIHFKLPKQQHILIFSQIYIHSIKQMWGRLTFFSVMRAWPLLIIRGKYDPTCLMIKFLSIKKSNEWINIQKINEELSKWWKVQLCTKDKRKTQNYG